MVVATMHEVFLFLVFGGYALSGPVRRVVVGRPPVPVSMESSGKDAPSSGMA
jgi:hypothetical protein